MTSVLLVNQFTGYLMTDIVNAHVASGKYEHVELFAGETIIRPSVLDSTVKVIKTVKYDKTSTLKRLLTWFVAFVHLLLVVWFKTKNWYLVLVSNPPLTIFIPLLTRKRFSYVVYDLYPDSLFAQGFIKKESWLGKWWMRQNKKVLAKAECVFTLSQDMKKAVAQYVDESKIKVIMNWAHTEHMKPIAKSNNTFLIERHLENKLIVLYSGNMGMTHDIDVIVDVANEMKENDNIHFFFIGEGAKKSIITNKIKEYHLNNCTVLPFQPLEVLPYSMGAADIAVVTTDNNQSGLSVPSKTYTYLATGAALLCLADEQTELGRLAQEKKVGKCFNKGEVKEMVAFINDLYQNKDMLETYKTNSRTTSLIFTPDNAKEYVL